MSPAWSHVHHHTLLHRPLSPPRRHLSCLRNLHFTSRVAVMSKQRESRGAKKTNGKTSAPAPHHDNAPGAAAKSDVQSTAGASSLSFFKRRSAMRGAREKEEDRTRRGITTSGADGNQNNEDTRKVYNGVTPSARRHIARPASAMAKLSAEGDASPRGSTAKSLPGVEEQDGEVASVMSAALSSHLGKSRSGYNSPAMRPHSALGAGRREAHADSSFRIDAPEDRPWRGGTAIGAGRCGSGKLTATESNEMITQMEGRLRAGSFKGGGWSGRQMSVG